MNIKTKTFLQYIESTTAATKTCLMVIRTSGPDACVDTDKVNEIYSAYKTNMDEENTEVFPTFLANEWTFLEFETEDDAIQFAYDNLPISKNNVDPDYFVQWWIFNSGVTGQCNDDLRKLSHRVVATPVSS